MSNPESGFIPDGNNGAIYPTSPAGPPGPQGPAGPSGPVAVLDVGTAPYPVTGDLRLGTDASVKTKTAAGDADVIAVDAATDTIQIGESVNIAETDIVAGTVLALFGGTSDLSLTSGALDVHAPKVTGKAPIYGLLATVPNISLKAAPGTVTALLATPPNTTIVTAVWLRVTTAGTVPVSDAFVKVGTNVAHDNWIPGTSTAALTFTFGATLGAMLELLMTATGQNAGAPGSVLVAPTDTLSLEIATSAVYTGNVIVTAYVFGFAP